MPGLKVLVWPLITGVLLTNNRKSETCFVPPLSFITVLVTVKADEGGGGGGDACVVKVGHWL